jgi:hypothetical protein
MNGLETTQQLAGNAVLKDKPSGNRMQLAHPIANIVCIAVAVM